MLVSLSLLTTPSAARADQVTNLKTQAKQIAEQLVEEQLQIGGYQQQYSVASAQVTDDAQAVTATQQQISADQRQVRAKSAQVQRVAIASYVYAGNESSNSNSAVFANNESTLQAAGEYSTITVGNLNQAMAQLRSAQHALAAHRAALVHQEAMDQSALNTQANALAQAEQSEASLQNVQAQVTGQLATAVAQANAAQAAAAVHAVAVAQRAAPPVPASSQATSSAAPPTTVASPAPTGGDATTDPVLPPFLACVVQAESGGDYGAVSPDGTYMGAFQFSQSTWNFAAQAAGLPSLVGVPPNTASKADQDTVAVALYALDGEQPWLGDRCSS